MEVDVTMQDDSSGPIKAWNLDVCLRATSPAVSPLGFQLLYFIPYDAYSYIHMKLDITVTVTMCITVTVTLTVSRHMSYDTYT